MTWLGLCTMLGAAGAVYGGLFWALLQSGVLSLAATWFALKTLGVLLGGIAAIYLLIVWVMWTQDHGSAATRWATMRRASFAPDLDSECDRPFLLDLDGPTLTYFAILTVAALLYVGAGALAHPSTWFGAAPSVPTVAVSSEVR